LRAKLWALLWRVMHASWSPRKLRCACHEWPRTLTTPITAENSLDDDTTRTSQTDNLISVTANTNTEDFRGPNANTTKDNNNRLVSRTNPKREKYCNLIQNMFRIILVFTGEIIEHRLPCGCNCGCLSEQGQRTRSGRRIPCPGCRCLVGPGCCWNPEAMSCHLGAALL
jgi:hypothetical protein